MEPISSAFETLAEIAGALLGFGAIAFALARGPEDLVPEDRIRLFLLLSLAVASIMGGILPHVLVSLGQTGASLWRTWSFAYVFMGTQIIIIWALLYSQMDSPEKAAYLGRTRLFRVQSIVVHGILATSFVAQIFNFLAIGLPGREWVCLAGLLFTVIQAAIILLTIIFLRPQRSGE
ncbi:MAG: hypothetical protein P8Q97_07895 [Myxococcota bacterium]|nr:hypothetical protein [Myxococcota bacterium]